MINKKIFKKTVIVCGIFVFVGIVFSGFWFLQRMLVGSKRHALNYQEIQKDIFIKTFHENCKNLIDKNIWISSDDPRYILDKNASSSDVYRYIVLDANVLNDESCVAAFIKTAINISYSTSIVLVGDGANNIAYFNFKKRSNL
jgi:hypothetical protein